MNDDEIKFICNALIHAFVSLDNARLVDKEGEIIFDALQIIKEEMKRRDLPTKHISVFNI